VSTINATFTDWLGVTIQPGDQVIYPAKWKNGGNKTVVLATVIKLSVERRGSAYVPVMIVKPLKESHERPAGKRRTMYPVRIKAFGSVTVVPKVTP
jgi:hypothetical protein